jgi:DNA-binding transcriptional MocR family regulator
MRTKKSLSGVALRLAAILVQKLNEYTAVELPSRNDLASILGVSRTAIINALAQLEEEQFIVREISELQGMVRDDEEQNKMDEYYRQQQEKFVQRKEFSGKFRLNPFYNQEPQSLNVSDLLARISTQSKDMVTQVLDSIELESRLNEIENRLKAIEASIEKKE